MIPAGKRREYLRVVIDKALDALAPSQDIDFAAMWGGLVCEILERLDWGNEDRIPRVSQDEPDFRGSCTAALKRYRARLGG